MFGSRHIWHLLQKTIESGAHWYYCDHAYFGREQYFRVTRDAYQHNGQGEARPDRFEAFGLRIHGWRKTGRNILVCPPDRIFASLMGIDADEWLASTLDAITASTDRPIIVRDRLTFTEPLEHALSDAWSLVTYMSNAAVEALIYGVPVFCLGPCAARDMGKTDLHQIEWPAYPENRFEWASVLADNQWTMREIARGECWERIKAT